MALSFQYLKPEKLDSKKVLCVFHGLGADAFDLMPVVDFAQDYHRYFFQAPIRDMPLIGGACSGWFTWQKHFALTSLNLRELAELIDCILDSVQKHLNPMSDSELHILGFSQGGVIALSLAEKLQCKSLALLSSFYDFTHPVQFNIAKSCIFVSSSSGDQIVPEHKSLELVHKLSPLCAKLESYSDPYLGHGINNRLIQAYAHFLQKID